jgi:hypothetical protein
MNIDLIKKAGITLAGLYAAAFALRSSTVQLKYFEAAEFGPWWPLMNSELLQRLDLFRELLGSPVIISMAPGSMGRWSDEGSQHFPRPMVNAVDVMTPGATMSQVYDAAKEAGFHGIGLYPHWQPHHGAHLDVRADRTATDPATWSAIKVAGVQKYVGVGVALA